MAPKGSTINCEAPYDWPDVFCVEEVVRPEDYACFSDMIHQIRKPGRRPAAGFRDHESANSVPITVSLQAGLLSVLPSIVLWSSRGRWQRRNPR